jgi:hypothetical protein
MYQANATCIKIMQANLTKLIPVQSLCTLSLFIASSYSDPFLKKLTLQLQSLAKLVAVEFTRILHIKAVVLVVLRYNHYRYY